jgi:signal transduction histidine kinase/ActR/RegA family two-component response regulator
MLGACASEDPEVVDLGAPAALCAGRQAVTSPQLDTRALLSGVPSVDGWEWQALRQPGMHGIALFDLKTPRCVAADADLCAALGYELGALDGVAITEIEVAHPFARSIAAWRRHVRNVRKAEQVEWFTWLSPRSGPSLKGRLRLQVQSVDRHEYLVAELIDCLGSGDPAKQDSDPFQDPNQTQLDAIPIGACRIARDGAVLASNALARAFLEFEFDPRRRGYTERLPNKPLSAEHEPLRAADLPWYRAFQEIKPQANVTLGLPRPDGVCWVLVSVTPDFSRAAGTSSALLTLTDVTAGKEASDALRDADRTLRRTISSVSNLQDQLARSEHMASLGLMAAGVAHEINNPLSYILSNLSFAAERAIDHESRLALREALEGAGRVRDIVRDLKTLSRMEAEDELKPVDARNAVDAALKLAFEEVRHRAKIQRHFSEVPQVLGDETRLVQVMLNLVTNAAQSIAPGAPDDNQISVEVKLAESGADEVEIVVTDTGAGISAAHLPKVFEPFFTTKPAGEGTGLGLSICHRLVHAMGGHIHVSSQESKGSRFSVFLCVAAPYGELEAPVSDQVPSSLRRLRLLIVDDEVMVARAAQRVFEGQFKVDIALDGKAALEKLAHLDYDVVLCDVMMPGLSGLDVYRQVRLENEALAARFVFATGGLFNQELSDSVKRLSNMIVEKPFDAKALRRVIEAAAQLKPSGIATTPRR